MASADVEKLAVFDSRIVQTRPKFAVEKGALSVTNAPFQALSQSTSQHTYSVQVPSETTFVDRAVNWTAQVGIAITFALPTTTFNATSASFTLGRPSSSVGFAAQGAPWGWAAFPLQSLTSTIQATINDTNVTINTSDVLKEVLRLVDIRKNTLVRQTPTKLDTLASAVADAGYVNGTYGAYINNAVVQEEVPNSASWISAATPPGAASPYVSSSGAIISAAGTIGATALVGSALPASYFSFAGTFSSGTPTASVVVNADGSVVLSLTSVANPSTLTGGTLTLYVAPTFTEKLVLSPFVFSDVHERDTGLFGIQNIQFVMNMRNPSDCRLIRQRETTCAISGSAAATGTYSLTSAYAPSMFSSGAFAGSRLDLLFLTPSLDLPLPPKSVVPYMEFPRYISTNNTQLGAASSQVYSTQTITLPQIPDYLVVYAKPSSYADATQGDWYLPISNVSIQWDNYAGLMSTHTQQQLYELSVENGLLQDYQQWSGRVSSPASAYQNGLAASSASGFAQSVGGMLVIKPGKDYALQVGQAPSLVGNYTLQLNVTLNNYSGAAVTPVIYVMTINSGFFESVKGTSRVVKGILSEADIIEAPLAPEPTTAGVARAVGGQGILKRMGHSIMKALPHVPAVLKAVAPVIKPHLPQAAQAAMSALGAAQPSRTGGRKSVHARLME